ncbi:MAG: hypothetical protein JWR45_1870 [Blastococcus sp.]|jgi:hypothetical protein|nr:hypothetical protein [Blastococcus sp.]
MTTPPNVPPARASDADREAVVRELHDAVARGLLSLEEGDERMAAAYAARFAHDLPPLTADLPPAPALLRAPAAPGWRAVAVLVWLQLRTLFTRATWRSVRARPRLAIAVVMVLAVLSFGAAAAGEAFDHGEHGEHADRQIEHVEN